MPSLETFLSTNGDDERAIHFQQIRRYPSRGCDACDPVAFPSKVFLPAMSARMKQGRLASRLRIVRPNSRALA